MHEADIALSSNQLVPSSLDYFKNNMNASTRKILKPSVLPF